MTRFAGKNVPGAIKGWRHLALRQSGDCKIIHAIVNDNKLLNHSEINHMLVFKFGGASISSIERIQNVGNILSQYSPEKILIIISAMGKTTNALEKVAEAFFAQRNEQALQLFEQVKNQHLTTA